MNAAQLAEMMKERNARAQSISKVDLGQLNRIVELTPEDMTATVEAGIALGELQRELGAHRQWLPIDPPNADAVSIHEMLSRDLSGPRRFGCGTIREHLIGMKVVLADGRTIKSGGKVVKNVAGYDLAKLFIGARDSLGIIVEATFKLRPRPEEERIVSRQIGSADEMKPVLTSVLDSEMTPIILDAYRLDTAEMRGLSIVLGLAGTRAEVEWQLGKARALGFETPASLDYEARFWNDPAPVNRVSVVPSRLIDTVFELGPQPFVARAGNGIIYHRGEPTGRQNRSADELARRIKQAYDPENILPELIP